MSKHHKWLQPRCSCYCTFSCRWIDRVIREKLDSCVLSLSAHDPPESVVIVRLSVLPTYLTNYMMQSLWEDSSFSIRLLIFFPQVSHQIPCVRFPLPCNATRPAYLPDLDLITRIFPEECCLCISLCSLFHFPVISSLLGPNNPFSNFLSLCSPYFVRVQVSHPYTTIDKIIVVYCKVYIF